MTFSAKTFTKVSSLARGRLIAEQRDNSTQANLLTSEFIRATYRSTHASEVSPVHLEAVACSFCLHHVQGGFPSWSLLPLHIVNCLHNWSRGLHQLTSPCKAHLLPATYESFSSLQEGVFQFGDLARQYPPGKTWPTAGSHSNNSFCRLFFFLLKTYPGSVSCSSPHPRCELTHLPHSTNAGFR